MSNTFPLDDYKLKKCPFCGYDVHFEEDVSSYNEDSLNHYFYIKCDNNECSVKPSTGSAPLELYFGNSLFENMVKAWNTRFIEDEFTNYFSNIDMADIASDPDLIKSFTSAIDNSNPAVIKMRSILNNHL